MTIEGQEPLAYTLDQVAELTGFSARTLLDGCKAKEIPHGWYRSRRVMTRAQIAEFLAAIEIRPQDAAPTGEVTRLATHRQRVRNRLAKGGRKARAA